MCPPMKNIFHRAITLQQKELEHESSEFAKNIFYYQQNLFRCFIDDELISKHIGLLDLIER